MEPLPPVKEVEYRCIVGRMFDELSGQEFATFGFETAKEFSSFRYEIAVRYKVTPGHLEFRVLGMTATRTMMPAFGTARSVLRVPALQPGIYNMLLIKSDGTENQFQIEVTKKGYQILPPIPDKRFIDLVIEQRDVMPGARLTSTVSTEPPPPLIPRTIQKRQPAPPTPEELAILESLKSETPEERDAREERELFGGGGRVPKSELAAAEKDLEELSKAAPKAAAAEPELKPKSNGAKAEAKAEPKADKHPAKPAKTEAANGKSHAKPAAKYEAKPESKSAKSAKPAAKPAPKAAAKTSVKSQSVKTSASKTPAKVAPKSAAKTAPAKKASTTKHVAAKTGSSKTSKTSPTAKKSAKSGKKK